MTTISRVFGLARDIVIATMFGAGLGSDAFFVAFKIPNYLRRLFAEGGFSQAFVPVLSKYKKQYDDTAVQDLIDHVVGRLLLITFGVTAIGVLAAPVLIMVFAPGFSDNEAKLVLASDMLRITFPYIMFTSLTAFAGGILNTYGRFAMPAFTPVLLNISLILCAVYLSPQLQQPVTALAWGVLIAGIAQLCFQLPFLLRIQKLPKPRFKRNHSGVSNILQLMVPALFAISVSQINLIIDMLMASFLQTGSISWLYYSDRLMEFPLGVFGVALATVILPNLSGYYAQGNMRGFSETVDWAMRWACLIAIPAAVGLILLAGPILITLFQYGQFSAMHATMSAKSLFAYAVGLPGMILVKVLSSSYFSRHEHRTPVRIGVIAMCANIGLNLILIGPLAHAGLALATSLAAFINAGLLFYYLRKDQYYLSVSGWRLFLLRLVLATVVMAVLVYFMSPVTPQWLDWDLWMRVACLSVVIIAAVFIYFVTLYMLGLRPQAMFVAGPH